MEAPKMHAKDDLVPLSEAAQRLGVHVGTLRVWIRSGKLPAYRMGARWTRVSWSEVLESMDRKPGGAR